MPETAAETIRIEMAADLCAKHWSTLLSQGVPIPVIVGMIEWAVNFEPRLGRPAPPKAVVQRGGMARPDVRLLPVTSNLWETS